MIYVTSGGGTGCTLVVTGVAGDNVTVSKDGKTYSKTFKDDGTATFKGLKSGTWAITMTDGESTATRTVEISADYTLTITYFSATINVTYPANSKCTITNSSGETVASDANSTDAEKTWSATVGATGNYTVNATSTDGTKSKDIEVSITTEGQVSIVTLTYEKWIIQNGTLKIELPTKLGTGSASYGSLTVTQNLGNVGFKTNGIAQPAAALTQTPIDISLYKTMYAIGYSSAASAFTIAVFDNISSTSSKPIAKSDYLEKSTSGKVELDLSAITGSYYVGVYHPTTNQNNATITDFWLE